MEWIAPVIAAVIAAVIGPVTVLVVRHEMSRRVGDPNGQGNVVQMLQKLIGGQADQDRRLARLEATQHEHETRIAVVEARTEGCPGAQGRA